MIQTDVTDLHLFVDRLVTHSRLDHIEQQVILGLPGRVVQLERYHDFTSADETVTCVSLVAAGFVARFDQTQNGARQLIAIYVPGEIPDLRTLVLSRPTSGLTALSPATIMRIPHSKIRFVAAKYPMIAEALWRECMVGAGIVEQWMLNNGRRDAKSRLAHLLCEMAVRCKADFSSDQVSYPFPITHNQLADATWCISPGCLAACEKMVWPTCAEALSISSIGRVWSRSANLILCISPNLYNIAAPHIGGVAA